MFLKMCISQMFILLIVHTYFFNHNTLEQGHYGATVFRFLSARRVMGTRSI